MVKYSYEKAVLAHTWRYAGASHHTEVASKLQMLGQDNTVEENLTNSKIELELELQNCSISGYSETQQQHFVPIAGGEACNMLQWFLRTQSLPKKSFCISKNEQLQSANTLKLQEGIFSQHDHAI